MEQNQTTVHVNKMTIPIFLVQRQIQMPMIPSVERPLQAQTSEAKTEK